MMFVINGPPYPSSHQFGGKSSPLIVVDLIASQPVPVPAVDIKFHPDPGVVVSHVTINLGFEFPLSNPLNDKIDG